MADLHSHPNFSFSMKLNDINFEEARLTIFGGLASAQKLTLNLYLETRGTAPEFTIHAAPYWCESTLEAGGCFGGDHPMTLLEHHFQELGSSSLQATLLAHCWLALMGPLMEEAVATWRGVESAEAWFKGLHERLAEDLETLAGEVEVDPPGRLV